jgi:carboxypeptidase Q
LKVDTPCRLLITKDQLLIEVNMKKLFRNKFIAIALVIAIFTPLTLAQDADINAKIRNEEKSNSQIMKTMHYLADVYGPRLTGSPNHKAAADWAVRYMLNAGFDKAELEAWDFGYPGWVNERASGFITSPVQDSLVFEVLSWTPGTKKKVAGQVFQLMPPNRPTQEELTNYLNEVQTSIKGKMVLMGKAAVIPVTIKGPDKRIPDEDLRKRLADGPQGSGNPNRPAAPAAAITLKPGALTNLQIAEQLDKFLLDNKAAVRINDAAMDHGEIRAFNNRSFDVKKVVPTVVLRNEDFGRIARILADGTPVSLEFDIRNKIYPEGKTSYNVVGELAGSDKKDEVIMLGGHLDSWHAATGATDNAIGCAVMMEAVRILKAIGVRPRRTIRVALWSGEEEGLLGSQAYVKKHFGSFEAPTAEYEKIGGYFNIDAGTGKARAMSVFGPPEAAAILRGAVAPFEDLGVLGATTTRSRGLGGSDHTSFNQAGLPGISVNQDPIEYFTTTWHTNLDTYERIIPDDVQSSAIVIAAAVYALAMRDEMLPRFSKDQMPPPPTPTPSPAATPKP